MPPEKLRFTVPGLSTDDAAKIVTLLQQRLVGLVDLSLTLKHVHWNVVGPDFVAVHEMLDPQYEAVGEMADETAERIATLGGTAVGTPGALVAARLWDDYELGKAQAIEHLAALDMVYGGVITDHRAAMDATEATDPVTQDMLIGQLGRLEQFHWFVRAHLERADGSLVTEGTTSERSAAAAAGRSARGRDAATARRRTAAGRK